MGGSTTQATGFVQTEMRKAAMALHTRDQAKEGQQQAQKPLAKWEPTRKGYLQFLVDSRHVYGAVEEIVGERAELATLKNTGLERTVALDKDIAWFLSDEGGCQPTTPTEAATGYAAELKRLSTPAFICHFYNYYFAHTAGGRMIGKQMSDMLLDGRVLEFYKWDGDVKELLDAARQHIDAMAASWTQDERDACLAQTAASFKGGGGLMASLRS
ncbi:hypothetical protein KFE25_013457 [Diacronema lutheri]|uniref:Heme oxygenase n=1 Tax=Diacronema lutheri TaxID=2081491 RepID=A0A8J5XQF0_DIALT|nr:hypothetical protein KFE25_013457 [Diacronema lutheri]